MRPAMQAGRRDGETGRGGKVKKRQRGKSRKARGLRFSSRFLASYRRVSVSLPTRGNEAPEKRPESTFLSCKETPGQGVKGRSTAACPCGYFCRERCGRTKGKSAMSRKGRRAQIACCCGGAGNDGETLGRRTAEAGRCSSAPLLEWRARKAIMAGTRKK